MEEKIEKEINKKSFPILGWYYLIAITISAILKLNNLIFLPKNEWIFLIYICIVHSVLTFFSIKRINLSNLLIVMLLGDVLGILNFFSLRSNEICLIYGSLILINHMVLFFLCKQKNNEGIYYFINLFQVVITIFIVIINIILISYRFYICNRRTKRNITK